MKIPQAILEVITKEEAEQLVHFYGTKFYMAYLNKLKKKYQELYEFLGEV